MNEILVIILAVSSLFLGLIFLGLILLTMAAECIYSGRNHLAWIGFLMIIYSIISTIVFVVTPRPEFKLIASHDLFDGKTFIGCKIDKQIINITSLTGRSDIKADEYKWAEYESAGKIGMIKWLSCKKYELQPKTQEEILLEEFIK
jgi:hypothetical protein